MLASLLIVVLGVCMDLDAGERESEMRGFI
jgi:hypothetical protein